MKDKLAINNLHAWSMEEKSEYFFLCEGEYSVLEMSKNDIDDLIELLYRIKGNYANCVEGEQDG